MELAVLLMKVDSSTFTHTETHKSKEHTITLRDQFKVSLMDSLEKESFKNRNCRLSKS